MDETTEQSGSDPFAETIETLARAVAHLALQLTITQIQLRGLGTALANSGVIGSDPVYEATAKLAEESAGQFLVENLGPDLVDLIDLPDLQRQIIAYLRTLGTGAEPAKPPTPTRTTASHNPANKAG